MVIFLVSMLRILEVAFPPWIILQDSLQKFNAIFLAVMAFYLLIIYGCLSLLVLPSSSFFKLWLIKSNWSLRLGKGNLLAWCVRPNWLTLWLLVSLIIVIMCTNGLLIFLSKLSSGAKILFGLVILWRKACLQLIGLFLLLLKIERWRLITSSTKIMLTFSSLLGTLLIVISLGLFSWKLEFLNLSTSSNWLIDHLLFVLGLNSFMTLFLNIPLRLLIQVLLLISRMINGVLLLVYQTL